MDGRISDLDHAVHAQVADLLGMDRAAELLGMLKDALVRLDGMSLHEMTGASGLAAIHRLKSEAGMMGFGRISAACQAVDAAGSQGAVLPDDLNKLRGAVASALRTIDVMSGTQALAMS